MRSSQISSRNDKQIKLLYPISLTVLILGLLLGLGLGTTKVSISEIISAITQGDVGVGERIIIYVRLPRVLGSAFGGAALALSGAVIQNVLCNRLASPGIIGVNSGAGLAVIICAACGVYGGWRLSLFAFLGAFAAVMAVSLCALKLGASRSTVILLGVAVNSILGAVSDSIIALDPDIGLMSQDFRLGDFSSVTYPKLIPAMLLITLASAVLLSLTNELDILTLGEENARGLGMNTSGMRVIFLLLASVLAGCAVSLAGLLSFVGLIVPHVLRLLGAKDSKHLLPLCAIFGGGFVSVCDTVSRTVFSPFEIQVGIIMAFLGAPFFVFLLAARKEREEI